MKRLYLALEAAVSVIFLESNLLPVFLYATWLASWSSEFRLGFSFVLGWGREMSVLATWKMLAIVFFLPPIWVFLIALCRGSDREAVQFGLRNHFVKVYFVYPCRFMRRIVST